MQCCGRLHPNSKSIMKKFCLVAITILAVSYFGSAQTPQPLKYITVKGNAVEEVTPDEVFVRVVLREYDRKPAGSVGLSDIITDFQNRLKRLSISEDRVFTESFYGQNLFRRKSTATNMKAYVSYTVKLHTTSEAEKFINSLNDQATESAHILRLGYSKEDELLVALQSKAVTAAEKTASELAATLKQTIGDPLAIVGSGANAYAPPSVVVTAAVGVQSSVHNEEALRNNYQWNKIKYNADVTVSFQLKSK
jgi:uncharacterized protein YggE